MELELGLKITRTRDDDGDGDGHSITSVSELRIAKDRAGPVFLSTENHAMFILTAHLKGYKRKSIEIEISEDGREICISGEKPIQEILMMGWVMMKNHVEIVGFKKVFKIPYGVVLDRIKAKYNEDESVLKIVMPKLVKGIHGVQIEEVKEEETAESSQKASETIQKEVEKPRFGIGDEFEATKNLTLEQNVEEDHIQKNNVVLSGEIGGTKEKEIETQDRDEGRVGIDITKQELKVLMETTLEGGESENVLARGFGVGGEDIVEETNHSEIKKPKFENDDGGRGSVRGEELRKEGVEEIGTTVDEQVPKAPNLLGKSENVLAREIGVSQKGINGGTKQIESEEPKIGMERVKEDISEEGIEVMEGSESVVESMEGGEDINEVAKQKEIEEPKIERVKEEASKTPRSTSSNVKGKEETDGIEKAMAKRKSEKAEGFMEKVEEEEPKKTSEEASKVIEKGYTKDVEERGIEENIVSKVRDRKSEVEGVEAMETTMKEWVPKVPILFGESENELARAFGVCGEDMNGGIKQKETNEPKFETERVREEISKERFEAFESESVVGREGGEEKNEVGKQKEIENPLFETERMREEISKERFEAMKESESVLGSSEGGEDKNEVAKQKEIGNPIFEAESVRDKISKEGFEAMKESESVIESMERGEDRNEVAAQKEIEKPMLKTERVREEISKEGFEVMKERESAVDSMEGGDRNEVAEQKEIAKPMLESERVREEISREGFEAMKETESVVESMEGGEDRNEMAKQKDIEKPMFGTKKVREEISKEGFEVMKESESVETVERGEERSEAEEQKEIGKSVSGSEKMREEIGKEGFDVMENENVESMERGEDRTEVEEQKEIEKPVFQTERMKEEISKEGIQVMEKCESVVETMEGGGGRNKVVKRKEIDKPMFETKMIREESSKEGFEAMKESESVVECMEGGQDKNEVAKEKEIEEPMFETKKVRGEISKEGYEVIKENESVFESMERGEDRIEVGKRKEIEKPVHESVKEEASKMSKRIKSKVEEMEETEGSKDAIIKRESQETEDFMEKVKGEEPKKINGEASAVIEKNYTKEAKAKGIEEDVVRKVFEVLGTDVPEMPTQTMETKAKRERKVKLKEDLVTKMHDEAQGDLDKDIMRDIVHTEIGQPSIGFKVSDEGGFDAEKTSGSETESINEDIAETETEIEKKCKVKNITRALQEVPTAEDPKALEKGMHERERKPSTQRSEAKGKGKACEDCKRSEMTLESEKHRETENVKDESPRTNTEANQVGESMLKTLEEEHAVKPNEFEREIDPLQAKAAHSVLTKEFESKDEVEQPKLKDLPHPKVELQSKEPLDLEDKSMKQRHVQAKEEEEEYEAGKTSEVRSSSSIQESLVEEKGESERSIEKKKLNRDFLEATERMTSLEDKQMEALKPNILKDRSFAEKEFFKPSTEDRGQQYMLENLDEKRFEPKKVAEEEKMNHKDVAERGPCKSKATTVAEREDCKKPEKINEAKWVAEEFKEAVAESETEKSKVLVSPKTMEIQSIEEIPQIRAGQQEKERGIPFHVGEVLEAVTPKGETESPKASVTNSKTTSSELRKDVPKGELDNGNRMKLSASSKEKLSKEPDKLARPIVKQNAPKVEIVPQLQERKDSIYPKEGTRALEAIVNEVDKASKKALEVKERGKTHECFEGGHLEFQEPGKQEYELDLQESTKRRSHPEVEKTGRSQQEESCGGHETEEKADEVQVENIQEIEVLEESTKTRSDLEVEKTGDLQQEESYQVHAIEEEKTDDEDEEGDEVEVENAQEFDVLGDIEVEESEDKKKLHTPLFIAGSALVVSLIVFFVQQRRAGKR